ncbi:TolC family protein [Niabella hibiscisoli]|uniref:TolC family protein n=1 Tax=Niabella hibiscisoli TaxID=1825928 RepID=UPI001F0D53F6|nr:TolC family protein [Niabella hibiscisoli]MCH5721157.1 TolC family protein [Niabella hibiscisoli]
MNRTAKALLFFSAALLSYADINAQDKRGLTLQEALELGIANSKNLKIDDAKIIEATAAIDEAKNRQLPDLKVSGSYLRLTNANINLKTGQQSSGEDGQSQGSSAAPKVNQAMYGIANFSLPLFAGGRIKYGIQSAKYLLDAAKLSAGSDKNEIAYNISQAYVNLLRFRR